MIIGVVYAVAGFQTWAPGQAPLAGPGEGNVLLPSGGGEYFINMGEDFYEYWNTNGEVYFHQADFKFYVRSRWMIFTQIKLTFLINLICITGSLLLSKKVTNFKINQINILNCEFYYREEDRPKEGFL